MDEQLPATDARVRRQYEAYPYPPRDPADEKKYLRPTYHDTLEVQNFYCYGGKRDFRKGFRALVAGGGTGDATIHLAWQLRHTDAEVVHLDISAASLAVARKRARVRGLTNITWVHRSLLELGDLPVGTFDYINCCGVLHHLPDPRRGLAALVAVLDEGGAMALMVYGRYGRTGVYQLQELLRLINAGQDDPKREVENAKQVLAVLPETNLFKMTEDRYLDHKYTDAGLYDLLLHPIDRPYTITEVYALLDEFGLNLVEFAPPWRTLYRPEVIFAGSAALLATVRGLPHRQQQAACELATAAVFKHEFYASPRRETIASVDDPDMVPFFGSVAVSAGLDKALPQALQQKRWELQMLSGHKLRIEPGEYAKAFLGHMDGRRTLAEIADRVVAELDPHPSRDEVMSAFKRVFQSLLANDLILLRHNSVPPMGGP